MATYFVERGALNAANIVIDGRLYHHLCHVLRVRVGDHLTLSDGYDQMVQGVIAAIEKKTLRVAVRERMPLITEPPLRVNLLQALPKGDKMDQIIARCTELGVYAFYPVVTDRCTVRLHEDRLANKVARWQKIADAAAEQSGRGRCPVVHTPSTLSAAIVALPADTKLLFFYENAREESLKSVLLSTKEALSYTLIVGPEGGFSDDEKAYLQQAAGNCISLGPRILRTETAGAATLTALMYERGDWG